MSSKSLLSTLTKVFQKLSEMRAAVLSFGSAPVGSSSKLHSSAVWSPPISRPTVTPSTSKNDSIGHFSGFYEALVRPKGGVPISRGPFYQYKKVYELAFPGFTLGAHLRLLTERESTAQGLDVSRMNLELLCADPMEGDARVQHDAVATVSPDWGGLTGTVQIKARPESRLTAVIAGIGKKYYGTFTESASSAANDLTESWTRIRRTRTGIQPDTRSPVFSTQTDTVMLKLIRNAGDQTDDLSQTSAKVTALAGTLKVGDVLKNPQDVYVVINVMSEGQFETAELRLG